LTSEFLIRRQHAAARELLDEARDLLLGRVDSLPVAWAEARGWSGYLLALSEDALDTADTQGIGRWFLADPDCPQSLRELARRVESLCVLPHWDLPEDPSENTSDNPSEDPKVDWPFTGARKRQQIAAVLHLLRAFYPRISELVDVGAGRGQLTTRAAHALSVPALGLERDSERVAVARLLARQLDGDTKVEFLTADIFITDSLASETSPLESLPRVSDRLLLALHGCGELGDALVRSAVSLSAHMLLLACCPQKIREQERPSLTGYGPTLPKEVLGLANVLSRTAGIEGSLANELATKEARLALRYLFEARGIAVPAGEEMRGVNRRKVHAGLGVLALATFQARGLPHPTDSELRAAAIRAHDQYLARRRLSLPRSMLGRVLEIFLALDRATFLLAAGYDVHVVELFPVEVSPRNIAVLGRLPSGAKP
jgi:Methyltransferase domain